ncbi:extracellular solute-binding protein [Georgenia halophila]|uniref:Extracellular solute-binding protein n=1 Tax=Georgenia halophila TaxID=620889 RepID=A0ABP8LGU5_9MICO
MRTTIRSRVAMAGLAATSLVLAACGQGQNPATDPGGGGDDGGGGNGDGQATVRFSWWGSDGRHRLNEELIAVFESQHPNIDIVPDYTDWSGYWDKLSTTIAAGDAPDVIMQDERYLREYGSRGVLADLSQYDIDTSEYEPSVLASGQFDGGLYGLSTGVNVYALMVNPRMLDEAGVEMPDDETWTWEDFHGITTAISENTEHYGFQSHADTEQLTVWARQHGGDLFSEDGGLGFSDAILEEYWDMSLALQESGAQPGASETIEIAELGPEQSLLGTGSGAFGAWWTNQLTVIEGAAGEPLELVRWPGESQFEQPGTWLKSSMLLSMSSTTEHPEEAAMFIDWMNNSVEAGEIILSDRGLPSNLEVREAIMGDLPDAERRAAEFIADLEDEVAAPPPVPPVGASDVSEALGRFNEQVLFETLTPEEAAPAFRTEAESILGQQ